MRISHFHIDGFGIFHDVSVKNLPAGFVLFSGDNEAGKSTFLSFLRDIQPQRRSTDRLRMTHQ